MQITQKTSKFNIVIISLILLWIINKISIGIITGKLKAVYIPIGFSILIMIPYIVNKIGSFPFLCGFVFIYWIPFNSGLGHVSPFLEHMYPTEVGLWMLCLGILVFGRVSRSAQFYSAVGRFPFLPFVLLIVGSLTANLVSGNRFALTELSQIRILCILPAVICFVFIYFLKTVKQAERLLWIFLISAGILGLVYLFAPKIVGPNSSYSYSSLADTSRVSITIKLPLFSSFSMNPETASIFFAFILAILFTLWLNNPSFRRRLMAMGVLAISALAIIRSQGRTGLIAATCSLIVIQVLSLRFISYQTRSLLRSLLKPTIIIGTLLLGVLYFASISEIYIFRQRVFSLFTDPLYALSSRVKRWEPAVDEVLDSPFGVGIFGFPSADGQSWIAHNLYLFLLLSFGIIGIIGFFWFFLRYTKSCWLGLHSNRPNRRILCVAGIGCVTILFVSGIGSCIFWSPWEVLMGWIPIGITMAVATLPEEKDTK